jgi:hypothetical protein
MRDLIFVVIIISIFAYCSEDAYRKEKFSSPIWKKDTIEYNHRFQMVKSLYDSDSLFLWSKSQAIEKLGTPEGNFINDSTMSITYTFNEKKEDRKLIYYNYLEIYYQNDTPIRFDIIEWDTLSRFKRLLTEERHNALKQ